MITTARNNKSLAYGVNHYIADSVDDLNKIKNQANIAPGCTAIVSGVNYYLDNNRTWIQITGSGSGSGSGDSALTEQEVLALLT